MSASEIVLQALIWGEESITEMINGTHESEPHRAELVELRRQMRVYRKRRYGKPVDPFANAKLVSAFDLPITKEG
jgi:hypothetical protein